MIITIILSVLLLIAIFKKGIPTLNGHWNTLLDEFQYSTKDFYKLLTKELQSHGINKISITNKSLSTGNALSKKRLYLRVSWKSYTYDCCCSPFGNGTFISWWMFSKKTGFELLISKIPFVGNYLAQAFFPKTYYSVDTTSMFMTYAQSSVLKVIDDITKEKGVRPLSETDKKPILRDVFKR
jgi:hypothetical protein